MHRGHGGQTLQEAGVQQFFGPAERVHGRVMLAQIAFGGEGDEGVLVGKGEHGEEQLLGGFDQLGAGNGVGNHACEHRSHHLVCGFEHEVEELLVELADDRGVVEESVEMAVHDHLGDEALEEVQSGEYLSLLVRGHEPVDDFLHLAGDLDLAQEQLVPAAEQPTEHLGLL